MDNNNSLPMDPVSREEQYLARLAGEPVELPTPASRTEQFLAKLAGESVETPEPVSREERYLQRIIDLVEGGLDNPKTLQALVRNGVIGQYLDPGDQVVTEIGGVAYDWDVEGIDEECPVEEGRTHCLSLVMHAVLNQKVFDPAQFLYVVTAAQWPDGMPAGTYTITLNHGAYDGGTTQDGTYAFTTTQVIPVGGGIKHSAIGYYKSGSYTKAQITGGTFSTYEADKLTTLESGLATTESDTGTSLGTTTASDPAKKSGDYINFSQRQAYGSNRWSTSWLRQWLNSNEATFTWAPATIWSRPVSGSIEGFLHMLDPELRAVLGKIRKRYALSIADGYGYEDVEDYVTLETMLDMGFGQNNSIEEGAVDASGVVKRTTAMALWAGSSQADKIKYQGATARSWWLGSTYPSNAFSERSVITSGALSNYGAYDSYGVVPRLQII